MSEPLAFTDRFRIVRDGVSIALSGPEAELLKDGLAMLEGLGRPANDRGAARLNPPVYLDDAEADAEWRKFAGSELDSARRADRSAYELLLDSVAAAGADPDRLGSVVASRHEAIAFLRVVNEIRLALAARWEIETPDDYDDLRPEAHGVLDFLGWIVSDLADVLADDLDG